MSLSLRHGALHEVPSNTLTKAAPRTFRGLSLVGTLRPNDKFLTNIFRTLQDEILQPILTKTVAYREIGLTRPLPPRPGVLRHVAHALQHQPQEAPPQVQGRLHHQGCQEHEAAHRAHRHQHAAECLTPTAAHSGHRRLPHWRRLESRPDPEGLFITSMTTAGVDVYSAMPDVMCSGLAGES
ncbi:hypothetical protein LAZ67_19002704 [Cordylochernes scorpioides]|uniref:Uncharacterized protein n=1 Tax=Cordylochernes scorpioides TaxID=51811 RepID=A0ABY6LLB6_9ARAC|nr:hypothetical protein LAZ67_19002704 [Cordylochernes scorpioides]